MTAALRPATFETPGAVRAALDGVADPEIPNVSIVELGMIGDVRTTRDAIDVELLPTFVGCPAIELIRASIERRLADDGRAVRVRVSFSTPWSSDRISPEGREKLRSSGFAPPPSAPFAASSRALPMLDRNIASLLAMGAFAAPVCRPIRCIAEGELRVTRKSNEGPYPGHVWRASRCAAIIRLRIGESDGSNRA